jgi:hypothetical protein
VEAEEIADVRRGAPVRLLAEGRAARLVRHEQVVEQRHPNRERVVRVEAAHLGGHALQPVYHTCRVVEVTPGGVLVRLVVQVPGQHAIVVGEGGYDGLQVQLVAGLGRAAGARLVVRGVVEIEQRDDDFHIHLAGHLHQLPQLV